MGKIEFSTGFKEVDSIIKVIEFCSIIICAYYIFYKVHNKSVTTKSIIIFLISTPFIAVIAKIIRVNVRVYLSWIVIIFLLSIINSAIYRKESVYTILITILSLSISYVLYVISIIISFIPNSILKINNDYISLIIILGIYVFSTYRTFKIKKLKYGLSFLKKRIENSYFSIIILTICSIALFSIIALQSYVGLGAAKLGTGFIVIAIITYIIIKQLLQTYYKQNLLVKDLEQTKSELEAKKKEVEKLERENLEFSKTSHSLAHRQKALEFKLEQLIQTGIKADCKEALEKEIESIAQEVYKEPKQIEFAKTEIESIDNMFLYMQSECIKANIKFELQIIGNIFYMINNLISEKDLEILIADHLKDAIIAIKHSDNENKSILVRIGNIDEIYSLYIYDSGIEFEKEVLENLGKKPITTHAEDGGTGMGFMNTFDTLNKTKASLTINEIGKPCIDNYTKVLIFKFDGQNEFKVDSYKNEVAVV